MTIGIILLGLLPMLAYTLILWWIDRYEREPWTLIAAAFLWGFLPAALFAVLLATMLDLPVALLLGEDNLAFELYSGSFTAPVVEEALKGLGVFLVYIVFHKQFDSLFDGILYASAVGFGFAAIENMLYFSETSGWEDLLSLAFLRAFVFGLNHAFYTSFIGIGFGLARHENRSLRKVVYVGIGYIAAVLAHSLHNTGAILSAVFAGGLLFSAAADWIGVLFILIVIRLSVRREGQWVTKYLRDEIEHGTLTRSQWSVLGSPLRRSGYRWGFFFRGQIRRWYLAGNFQNRTSRLAFEKYRQDRLGASAARQEDIQTLRLEVAELSGALG